MGDLDTNAYYALGIPLYLIVMGTEIFLTRKRGMRVYYFGDTISNLSGGLGEIIIGLFLGPFLFAFYNWLYQNFALIHWEKGSITPWIIALFLSDFCYYLYHRMGHTIALFWAIHGVHHQSEQFNVSVALRHPWFSDSYSAIFYIPLPLLGIDPIQFFLSITLISFYALAIHSKIFNRPTFYLFVTPATHIVHHCKNPRYIGKNLGAMFTLWDRMFGTHVDLDPDDPPEIGPKIPYETHNGAYSQWIYFRNIFEIAKKSKSWKDKFKAFIGPPGWHPAEVQLEKHPPARKESTIPLLVRLYVGFQFAFILFFSVYILWFRDHHPFSLKCIGSLLVLWSISTLGNLLDAKGTSLKLELLRLSVAISFAFQLIGLTEYQKIGWLLTLLLLFSLLWLLYFWSSFQKSLLVKTVGDQEEQRQC